MDEENKTTETEETKKEETKKEERNENTWQQKIENQIAELRAMIAPKEKELEQIPAPKAPQKEEPQEQEIKIVEQEQPKKKNFLDWLL